MFKKEDDKMSRGKLIVIEGTDCSGKETQSNMLLERLKKDGLKLEKKSFPMYDTPTGYVLGACLLGKPHMGECIFPEGTTNVPPKVAALYYAADRLYNIETINKLLDDGVTVILDRYVESNMGHQGAKIFDKDERMKLYDNLSSGEITLTEGKYHQIKRMLEAVNNKITYLERISFGNIVLDPNLKRGEWRYLTSDEEELFNPSVTTLS